MSTTFTYTLKFVANMDASVRFHVEKLGLKLKFQSPQWTEFDTGPTTLALHEASPEHPAGSCQVAFRVDDIERFCAERAAEGVTIVSPPTMLHGQKLAKLRDNDGAEFSVSSR